MVTMTSIALTMSRIQRSHRHRGLLFYRLIEGALAAQPAPYNSLITRTRAATQRSTCKPALTVEPSG